MAVVIRRGLGLPPPAVMKANHFRLAAFVFSLLAAILFLRTFYALECELDHRKGLDKHVLKAAFSSGLHQSSECECTRVGAETLFQEDQIESAISIRRDWSKKLPFTIEKLLSGHSKSLGNFSEREFSYGHKRFDLLGPVAPKCERMEMYGRGDGEKRACGLKRMLLNFPDCTIISLGSKNMWDFEEDIYDKMPNCKIHTFDCTVSPGSAPPRKISGRTKLHRICIGSKDMTTRDGLVFKSWGSIMTLINATAAPLYLKMDIEGYEYQVLQTIIDGGRLMPMQIAFELHYRTQMPKLSWNLRSKSSAEIATFMEYLYHEGGYFLIDRHDNNFCGHCTELLISRLQCECRK